MICPQDGGKCGVGGYCEDCPRAAIDAAMAQAAWDANVVALDPDLPAVLAKSFEGEIATIDAARKESGE